jgi:hypothetical protein
VADTLELVLQLVRRGEVRISEHGYDEMAADGILATSIVNNVEDAILIEDYPSYPKGPCVLVRQRDELENYIHVVWGIPRGRSSPAVVVTAYRPDTTRWSSDFLRRER